MRPASLYLVTTSADSTPGCASAKSSIYTRVQSDSQREPNALNIISVALPSTAAKSTTDRRDQGKCAITARCSPSSQTHGEISTTHTNTIREDMREQQSTCTVLSLCIKDCEPLMLCARVKDSIIKLRLLILSGFMAMRLKKTELEHMFLSFTSLGESHMDATRPLRFWSTVTAICVCMSFFGFFPEVVSLHRLIVLVFSSVCIAVRLSLPPALLATSKAVEVRMSMYCTCAHPGLCSAL
jgi:hypothetical protein